MKTRITNLIVTLCAVAMFAFATPLASAQQDTQGKPTTTGQMKEGGNEAKKAGKSMATNLKHGRVRRAGVRFGRHAGHAARHVARGTKHAVVKAIKP